MAEQPDDYDLWRRVVEALTGNGAPMSEAIEGADLVLQARRRPRQQIETPLPPEDVEQVTRSDTGASRARR